MKGRFIGIGVGPGDPELMTLKAVRVISECGVIAVPVSDRSLEKPLLESETEEGAGVGYLEKCAAYRIALGAVPEAAGKKKLFLPMPMIKDRELLKDMHDRDADAVAQILDKGTDVVFLTLGDPTVYSTCMYVHKRLKKMSYETMLIPGIPSFCAAAARLDIPIAENSEEIHIVPASYEIEDNLRLDGTKILMKAGRKMPEVKAMLKDRNMEAKMVENCGMEEEHVYLSVEDIPDEAGYYSLLIVKKGQEGGIKR